MSKENAVASKSCYFQSLENAEHQFANQQRLNLQGRDFQYVPVFVKNVCLA